MTNPISHLIEEEREEMYKELSKHFRFAMEKAGEASLQYGKVVIPDIAIYKGRDKAIEYVESLLSSHDTKLIKAMQEVVESKKEKCPECDGSGSYKIPVSSPIMAPGGLDNTTSVPCSCKVGNGAFKKNQILNDISSDLQLALDNLENK